MKLPNKTTVLSLTERESEVLEDLLTTHCEWLNEIITNHIEGVSVINENDYQGYVQECTVVENILMYLGVEGYEFT